jgi:hypothetical protein
MIKKPHRSSTISTHHENALTETLFWLTGFDLYMFMSSKQFLIVKYATEVKKIIQILQ